MCPSSVTVPNVPDRELGSLLTQLSRAGFESPIIKLLEVDGISDGTGATASQRTFDLADDWRLAREREGESYGWPNGRDRYSRYRVFIGTTRAEGAVQTTTTGSTIRALGTRSPSLHLKTTIR